MSPWLLPFAIGAVVGLVIGVFYRTYRATERWAFGDCTGCGKWACPKVGRGMSRRRLHAYCPQCMPELYAHLPQNRPGAP